ncbi:hypothetical protein ACEQ8H_002010 [Pleosporales sp. CAS-2024a]
MEKASSQKNDIKEAFKRKKIQAPAPFSHSKPLDHHPTSIPTIVVEDYDQSSRVPVSLSSVTHHELADDGFRLLSLEPGDLGSKIIGRIQEYNLIDAPAYYAPSYVWGQEPLLHPATIDGTDILIRPNLFHAIQRIRTLQKVPFTLWIDSLCIDQANDTERSAQVGRMAQIYHEAAGVFIWLGEEDSTSKLAIELVKSIYEDTEVFKKHESRTRTVTNRIHTPVLKPDPLAFSWDDSWWTQYRFTALSVLMERPRFRRGWVLQEAAFSSNSTI